MTDPPFPIGQRVTLPGHFPEPVVLEAVRPRLFRNKRPPRRQAWFSRHLPVPLRSSAPLWVGLRRAFPFSLRRRWSSSHSRLTATNSSLPGTLWRISLTSRGRSRYRYERRRTTDLIEASCRTASSSH